MLDFVERRKTVEPEEEPLEQSENQQQTQLTYGTGQESNLGHINGRQLLSLLNYPCSPQGPGCPKRDKTDSGSYECDYTFAQDKTSKRFLFVL